MRRVLDYNDFMFDYIFEAVKVKNELSFRLSKRLIKLLNDIDHPISKHLLNLGTFREKKDITFVDLDETDIGSFTYVLSNKLYDVISLKHNEQDPDKVNNISSLYYDQTSKEMWTKFRTSSRIGRFVNRVFPDNFRQSGEPGNDIESFVNAVKTKRSQQFERFKIVKGNDIVKYYLDANYDSRGGEGTGLGNSCMRYSKCQKYLDFYAKNDVEMVILMSEKEEDKIMGRALLWDIKEINGEKVTDKKYMDRIYVASDYDIQNFKDYASLHKWFYKKNQNRQPDEMIYDPTDMSFKYLIMKTADTFKESKYYPYLDTLAYFYSNEGYLSNKSDFTSSSEPYFLQATNGTYIQENRKYVEYYGEWIDEDELTYCEYGNDWRRNDDVIYISNSSEYATREYAEENMVFSEIMDEYLDREGREDIIHLDYYEDWVTMRYAERHMFYSDHDDQYYRERDVVHSDFYSSYILKDTAIKVLASPNNYDKTDWRVEDDDSYITYMNPNGRILYYDKDEFGSEFVLCIHELGNPVKVWKHLEWDKEHLVEYKGQWYWSINLENIKKYIDKHEKT